MYSLTKKELEVPRMPLEGYEWCCSLIETIASTNTGTNALRMKRDLCKQLLEEVHPVMIWAKKFYENSEEVKIKPIIGSQNYDAVVINSMSDKEEFFIEVTQAHEENSGYQEHLRVLHLMSEGWTTGPFSVTSNEGKKTCKKIKPGRVLHSMDGLVQKTLERISEAINKKISKNYPSNTHLLVTFDDHLVAKENSIEQTLLGKVNDIAQAQKSNFPFIYLVGKFDKLLFIYDAGNH